MQKLPHILRRKTYKAKSLASGYYLLESAEALLKEASTDPRNYGKVWYLVCLLRMERLLDALRPSHSEVGSRNFDIYDKREQTIRQKISQFADTIDPKLRDEIFAGLKKYEEDLSLLPNDRESGEEDTVLDIISKF